MRLIYVAGLLEGDALALTSTRMDPDHPQYYQSEVELYQHLKELYADPNKVKNARAEFKRLIMKKDQTFQTFYATFLRLVADGEISSTDLKDDLNEKLSWKLQEAVAVYYNDSSIKTTQFAQYCTTLDQQIRYRASRQGQAEGRRARDRKKPEAKDQSPDRARDQPSEKPGDGKEPDQPRPERERSSIKCFNCDKTGHIARNCRAPKKEDKKIAQVEEVSKSENDKP